MRRREFIGLSAVRLQLAAGGAGATGGDAGDRFPQQPIA